jgi:hypothetical protein
MKDLARHAFWVAAVVLSSIPARADYVADDGEIAAMKARILKNPPTPAVLSATPYPGSKLDAECSADQSASNQPNMVYCLYTLDPIEKVQAYVAGPGKPADGVSAFVNQDQVVENGVVKIADVTQVRYYVFAKKATTAPAAAAAPSVQPAADPVPEATATPAGGTTAEASAPATAPDAKQETGEADAADATEKAIEGVKKLKGLFGR